jgi:U3 small nucleolar RNA-associated protein 7
MRINKVQDLRVKTKIKRQREFNKAFQKQMAAYNLINPTAEKGSIEVEEGDSPDLRMSQEELKRSVDVGTSKKLFDFQLKGGPFQIKPTRNGKHVVVGGKCGQLSVFDRTTMNPMCDFIVDENVIDVTFLHNYTMFAAAQRKCAYIYDTISGAEIHCLKDHGGVTHIDFLPFHFLLASWSESGIIRYLDTSTGQQVARHFSKMGPCQSFRQNMATSLINVGHKDGCVSLWAPSIAEPLLKIKAHYGPVTALACHDQSTLVTGGGDGKWKIWDLRKPDKAVYSYSYRGAPPSSIDISQTGMISIGNGVRVSIFSSEALRSKVQKPYLTHNVQDGILSTRFCPFEDILLLGRGEGIGTMLVPGSGSGEFDSYTNNPFETRTQRREGEVRSLLEKLRPDMISLPFAVESIGSIAPPVVVEDNLPKKKLLGKKQLKRRQVREEDLIDAKVDSKLDKLGKSNHEGKYDPLTRFK